MANQKKVVATPKTGFKYVSASVAVVLIVFGLSFGWSLPFYVGIVLGLVWLNRYSKDHPKFRLLWYALICLLLAPFIYVTIVDIARFYQSGGAK